MLFLKLKNPLLENCQENLSSSLKTKFNSKFRFFLIEFKKEKHNYKQIWLGFDNAYKDKKQFY